MKSERAPIALVATGLDVAPLRAALLAQPALWDKRTARTASAESPHHGLSDIWARWAPEGTDPAQRADCVWYADADVLPVRSLVYALMGAFHGDELGGVLITRIPAGAECRPHIDRGWHAERFQKFGVQIAAAPGQAFQYPDHGIELETAPGDVFWFDNSMLHAVANKSSEDRITMIVCIKTDWRP